MRPELINCVGPDGTFTDEAPDFVRGRWVKDCDKDIIRDLKERGPAVPPGAVPARLSVLLAGRGRSADPVSAGELVHPHDRVQGRRCSPTTPKINWLPEHIKDGRFGKFLESNVDWALSRERYWGTPLPIWVCERDGQHGGHRQLRRTARQARRRRDRGLGSGERSESRTARRSAGPQAVHRCGDLRLAVRRGRTDAARDRGDRLLVRLAARCHSPSGAIAGSGSEPAERPSEFEIAIPRRLHQRSARPNPRLVL